MKKAPCSSEDQEEMMDCTPVQCETKYSGTRNYFNITDQLCEKPASCYSDRKFPLPTKVCCGMCWYHAPKYAVLHVVTMHQGMLWYMLLPCTKVCYGTCWYHALRYAMVHVGTMHQGMLWCMLLPCIKVCCGTCWYTCTIN